MTPAGLFRSAALLLACALSAAPARARSAAAPEYDQLQVVVDGGYKGAVQILRARDRVYLDALETARLLGGSASFSGGRLEVRFKGFKACMRGSAREARYGSKLVALPAALQPRGGRPFAPAEFFTADEFGAGINRSVSYNETANSLDVDRRYQVGEMDYYSYGAKTTVSFELRGVNEYTTVQSSPTRIDLIIPGAAAQTYETVGLNDGVIDSVSVSREGAGVKIALNLSDADVQWNTSRDGGGVLTVEVSKVIKARQNPPVAAGRETPAQLAPPPVRRTREAELESAATIQQHLNIPDTIVRATGRKKIIVIDAGHGGKDPGCNSRKGLKEKNINLAIAKELAALFKDDERFQVVMTRDSDCFIPLDERSAAANRLNADMFISIHANANRRRAETGFEVYFMSENAKDPWAKEVAAFENSVRGLEEDNAVPPEGLLLHSLARNEYMNESAILAGFIAEKLDRRVSIKNRGVNQAPFYVLRGTYAPAVLIETGFMTNPKEAAALNKEAVRRKIAQGVFEGVLSYAKSKNWFKAGE